MKGAHFTFTHCTFVDNVAESSIGMKSFISAKSNSQVTVASCCFFTQQKGGHTIETEDNSKLIFEGNSATFFNCAADLAFNQNDATIENPSNVLFTQTECRIPLEEQSTTGEQDDDSNSSTGGDDENPGDEEKKITRYVYIGIGALAIAVVIAIVVFLCFRISGKCKKFEQKSEGELNDIGDKRDSYLLQEADGEIQETEL
ncbi:hypothetical protein TRFO_30888 [Tritrichomonas foetus]|uniref:Uncharacterized protein n=1 Tax=Tritrichomonas foetus TaxID=1144522 RepID=A0A1J4JUH2_9EUKA|nr:hypothetical protein TRFO_30888 [Tritrichomonas foetus]|eukprot:OHT02128.1 hypothetical protein TRFO_30888 [Tritrichomonas foetus]